MNKPVDVTITASDGTSVDLTSGQLRAASMAIKLGEIAEAYSELEALCYRKIDATEAFSNACKAVAFRSGVDAAVLSAYVTARTTDTLRKKQRKAEQLTLLFEELGG